MSCEGGCEAGILNEFTEADLAMSWAGSGSVPSRQAKNISGADRETGGD